jgi:hypothetical protein
MILGSALVLCLGMLIYTAGHFRITSDLSDMVSKDLDFRQNALAFKKAFPSLKESLVLVVQTPSPEQTSRVRDRLTELLKKRKDRFRSVYAPGSSGFFERNGLLYLDLDQLQDISDRLATIQPFLALLTPDLSVARFVDVMTQGLEADQAMDIDHQEIMEAVPVLNLALKCALEGEVSVPLSWQELVFGHDLSDSQQFITLDPVLDPNEIPPGKKAITAVREVIDISNVRDLQGVEVALTGKTMRNYEDLQSVRDGIGLASMISIILVGIILFLGLGSIRMVVVCLTTLIIGLILTFGVGILVVGRLNLISVTFVVLFIGLGIDYSIQICLHFLDSRKKNSSHGQAMREVIQSIGGALILCSLTTAIGFLAFVPTAYKGASELGLIAGVGMIINCLVNLSVLPALLCLISKKRKPGRAFFVLPGSFPTVFHQLALPITAMALILGVLAVYQLPKLTFDPNPLNISNPKAESIVTAKHLFQDSKTSPWTASALRKSSEMAEDLAASLKDSPEVRSTLTITDFIPAQQEAKLNIVTDISLFMPFSLGQTHIVSSSKSEVLQSLERLTRAASNEALWERNSDNRIIVKRLATLSNQVKDRISTSDDPGLLISSLETSLLPNLRYLLISLDTLLRASGFGLGDLPDQLRQRYVSDQGDFRVQIFPEHTLLDPRNLVQFADAIRSLAPEATGPPITTLEAGWAIGSAFREATTWAIVLIGLLLLMSIRPMGSACIILVSLMLSLLFTVALCAATGIAFNFANIIVVPLLLGIGVDFSIHLVHRYRTGWSQDKSLLQTPTSRGILFSGLTTIGSFGSLAFLSHKGTASMGLLLVLSVGCMIAVTLVLLPALLTILTSIQKWRKGE